MKVKGTEILITICVFYTAISLVAGVVEWIFGQPYVKTHNLFLMFLWSGIGVLVLNMHMFFERFSPLTMIILQYLIATFLVFVSAFIMNGFTLLNLDGFWEVLISFTVPYIIGAIIYYIDLFQSIKRQNLLLEEIKNSKKQS